MRTLPRLLLTAFAGTSFIASGFADTVVLKSGEKIEGKIKSETDAEVIIESKSGGIVDEQTVKRADIQSISKEEADAAAWAPLAPLKPGANSLPSAASYDAYINPLKAFATQFPTSKHKDAAEKAATEFE